jgi:hypothetical protein
MIAISMHIMDDSYRRRRAQATQACRARQAKGVFLGTFPYRGEYLTWLQQQGLITWQEIDLGQSLNPRDRRIFDLALRRATGAVLDAVMTAKNVTG